jgi:MoxR-like ATPase
MKYPVIFDNLEGLSDDLLYWYQENRIIKRSEFIKKYLSWGAGPRASQYLILGGKARALSKGRYNVTIEDINALAVPVLRHRIVNNYAAEAEGFTTVKLIEMIIESLN